MNLAELVVIASSEEKSEEFLRAKGVLKNFECCPFCGSKSKGGCAIIWRGGSG